MSNSNSSGSSSSEEESSSSSSSSSGESSSDVSSISHGDSSDEEDEDKKEEVGIEKEREKAMKHLEMNLETEVHEEEERGDEYFNEEINRVYETHERKAQEINKIESIIKTKNLLKQLVVITCYKKDHTECRREKRRRISNRSTTTTTSSSSSSSNIEEESCNPRCLTDFVEYTDESCKEQGLDQGLYYCTWGRFHDCNTDVCPGDLNNSGSQPSCEKTGRPKAYMFTSNDPFKEEQRMPSYKRMQGRGGGGGGGRIGRGRKKKKTRRTRWRGRRKSSNNNYYYRRGTTRKGGGAGGGGKGGEARNEISAYLEEIGNKRFHACKERSRIRDLELNKVQISESIQLKRRIKRRQFLKNHDSSMTSKKVIGKKTRLKKSTKELIFPDLKEEHESRKRIVGKNREKEQEEDEDKGKKVMKGFELFKNMFVGKNQKKGRTSKIKEIIKTFQICTHAKPIRINNDVSDKQTDKLKDGFKYPIYFLSFSIFYFLKKRVTLEQMLIQTRTLSFAKMWKNGCNEMFEAYYHSPHSSMDTENFLVENAKDFLEEYINVMKTTERVGLLGLWPGINRIVVDMKHLPDGYSCLFAKGKKYIEYCKAHAMPIDAQTYFYLTDADAQIQNETNLQDLYEAHKSKEKLKRFWEFTTNIKNRSKTINYIDWPTFEDLQRWDMKTLALYTLVKFSGASDYKRQTIDPIEVAIVSTYLFFKGKSKWFPNRSQVTFIPKDLKLSKPGYVLYYNQLGKTLGIKGCSKSHIQGIYRNSF